MKFVQRMVVGLAREGGQSHYGRWMLGVCSLLFLAMVSVTSQAAQVTFDFEAGASGGGTATVQQTSGSDTLVITAQNNSILWTDNGFNGGVNPQSPISGNFAYMDIANNCEKVITFSVQGSPAPLFNLDAIDIQETQGDSTNFILTSSKGGTAAHSYAGGDTYTFNTASDTNFQNITSFTLTASGDNGFCLSRGDAASFYAAMDNVKLSNIHLPTYSVTYNGNGNTGGSAPTDATAYSSGNTVTVLGNTGSLTKTGYSFSGWNTASNGSGTNYSGGGTFSIAADTILYAKWTANPPTVTTGSANSISATAATFGGTINDNGLATTASFDYGTTIAYGSTASAGTVTAGAGSTAISASVSSLACGTTYHFRAKGVSAGGTVNGSDATFTTSACLPTVNTGSGSSLSQTSATVGGTVSSNGSSTTVTFEYGTTVSYGGTATAAESPLASGASSAAVSAGLTGLTCNSLYHFRVSATNTGGTTTGSDATFTTSACAPTATTGAASSISATGASLGGTVSSNGASTTVTFEYGTTASYGSTATAAQSPLASGASGSSVSAVISSLTCNTTYHFRVSSTNGSGTTNGSDATFTTSACAPTATTGSASSLSPTGATLGGTVSSNGAATTVVFEYGATAAYGSSITAAQSPLASGASGSSVSAVISGLTCNTTYHFRVDGTNSAGSTNGSDATFTTSACGPSAPTATTGSASSITATGAALAGTIVDNGATTTVSFEYGLTTGYGSTLAATPASVSSGAGSTAVSATLSSLSCNTTYHFRVKGVNAVGTTNGSDATFTTAACVPTATTGAASSVGATGATLAGTIVDNGATTTVSFEYGLTTGYGSTQAATPASVTSGAGSTAVSATLTGLLCNTTYHFRVKGVNSAGTTNGSDATFTTVVCPPAVSAIAPATGPALGGTSVVITGVNLTGASAVKFGSNNAAGFTVNSASQITATAPAGAAGTVDVTVTTAGGTSAISAADRFTYDAKTYAGPLPGGGSATATITGGGASCGFNTAQFLALSSVPTPPPAGYSFNQGLFDFRLTACDVGQPVTISITYSSTPGSAYWKYGPTAADISNHWYQLPGASVSGNTVTFSITDGGLGDDDRTADGTIIDAGGPGFPGAQTAVPTLSEWALILLSLLVLGAGFSTLPSGWFSARRQ